MIGNTDKTDNSQIVLFGTGATGRFVVRDMIAVGAPPVAFADNDQRKWGMEIEGISVYSPADCATRFPNAEWIATVMDEKFEAEIVAQIAEMGVKTSSFWDFLPNRDSTIPPAAVATIAQNAGDEETLLELYDQIRFRQHRNHLLQRPATPLAELYFPDFITRREDEHFVDAGAADGDTIRAFVSLWPNFSKIVAFEPDPANMAWLRDTTWDDYRILRFDKAISDFHGELSFTATGDYSAHLDNTRSGTIRVGCWKLDEIWQDCSDSPPPTFIKLDIEGSEPAALWGARSILKHHRPVLAVCAYHTADHLWELPLLIHALQPEYKLFLRRYRPGSWEHVYYAVPPERIAK